MATMSSTRRRESRHCAIRCDTFSRTLEIVVLVVVVEVAIFLAKAEKDEIDEQASRVSSLFDSLDHSNSIKGKLFLFGFFVFEQNVVVAGQTTEEQLEKETSNWVQK